MTTKYKMYGSEFSLYSGKIRSYLRKKGIPYTEILSTLKVYQKFILPRTGVQYIPVVQTPEDEVIQDTSVIIDELEKRFPENSAYPDTPRQKLLALLLEVYADEWLLIPAMHYRWYFKEDNYKVVTNQFGAMLKPGWPKFLQGFLGRKVASRFQGAVKLLGVHDSNREAVEASYETLLQDLQIHFSQHDYLFGSKPSIADFGFIGPFYAHLYKDPYPGKMLKRDAPAVTAWVERMQEVGPVTGSFLANDEIPETLLPIIQRMVQEHLPVILDTNKRLDEWRQVNPSVEIPRQIGQHSFKLAGTNAMRKIFPYLMWMWQRPVDYYQSLPDTEKHALDEQLSAFGLKDALNTSLLNRVEKSKNKLIFSHSQ